MADPWDRLARFCPDEFPAAQSSLAEELGLVLSSLVPPIVSLLEAGCGSGFLGIGLARKGFKPAFLDASRQMLTRAAENWDRFAPLGDERPPFYCLDLLSPETASAVARRFDCVFNAGVLEHFDDEGAVALLSAMSRLSRRYVVALAPNSRCPVYNRWRERLVSLNAWPYGPETFRLSLSKLFCKAGLQMIAEIPMGHVATGELAMQLIQAGEQIWPGLLDEEVPLDESGCLLCCVGRIPGEEGGDGSVGLAREVWQHRLQMEIARLRRLVWYQQVQRDAAQRRLQAVEHTLQDVQEVRAAEQARFADAEARLAVLSRELEDQAARARRLSWELSVATHRLHELESEKRLIETSRGYRLLQVLRRWRDACEFLSATGKLRLGFADLLEATLGWSWRIVWPRRLDSALDGRVLDPQICHTELCVFTSQPEAWSRPGLKVVHTRRPTQRNVRISLITTVRNEAAHLPELIGSIAAQTRLPDEWIVVDGGSTDGTVGLLRDAAATLPFPVRIIERPGCNIAQGRNLAIEEASYDCLAVTDASCRLEPQWLESLMAPFEYDEHVGAVIGVSRLHPDSRFPLPELGEFWFPSPTRLDPCRLLPSSRSFGFRRQVVARLGGYPEHLTRWGEDTLLCLNLTGTGVRWAFSPEAVCWWRGPAGWSGLLRKRFCYALGSAEARVFLASAGKALREILCGLTLLVLGAALSVGAYVCLLPAVPAAVVLALTLAYAWDMSASKSARAWRRMETRHSSLLRLLVGAGLIQAAEAAGTLVGLWRSRGVVMQRLLDLEAPTIVFLPSHEWFWMKQRPGHLAEAFTRYGFQVLFCPHNVAERTYGGFWKLPQGVVICNDIGSLSRLKHPILYSLNPRNFNARLVRRLRSARLVLDLADPPSAINAADREIIRAARVAELTVASSAPLAEYLREVCGVAPLLLRNAVRYEDWRPRGRPAPNELAAVVQSGRVIVGYAGALGYWVDFALLREVASARPEWCFVLIGPVAGAEAATELASLPANVAYIGTRSYHELPAYVETFHAAMIPFVVDEATRTVNPVKLYEYAALQVPTVSTDLPECRESGVTEVAGDARQFLACLDKAVALRKDPEHAARLRDFALQNTWDRRLSLLLSRLGLPPATSEAQNDPLWAKLATSPRTATEEV